MKIILNNKIKKIEKLCLSKKALLSYDVSMWAMIKLIFLAIVVVFVLFTINLLVINDLGVENQRAQTFVERVLSSPDCLPYYNENIDRSYSNIIDSDKFKTETLENCIDYGANNKVSAKLTLKNLDKPVEKDKNPITILHKGEDYEKWEPFSLKGKYYSKINKQRYVLIKDNDETYRGRLQMEVITRVG